MTDNPTRFYLLPMFRDMALDDYVSKIADNLSQTAGCKIIHIWLPAER
jgi:hypothetical protein